MKKKNLLFMTLLLCANMLHSQLYVSNNSFVYNKNNVVYVTGNVELNGANSNFYLRREGQLLQGTTGSSTNKGAGKLSVFQEGTVNNYAYNYWCSPVGNASASSGNEDFGVTMLSVPTSVTASNPATFISNDSDGQCSAGSLAISDYWIWRFLSGSNYSNWLYSGTATNISAGQGFTMKGEAGTDATNVGETAVNNPGSAQRYDFRGKPNDGNITVNVGNANYTLTGNPYPSAMHVNAFLLDAANAACTGVAYYWEQDKTVNSHNLVAYVGGYGTYSPISLVSNGIYVPATWNTYNIDGTLNTTGASSGLLIERKYAPIGQGFMVKGNANGTLTLKNSYRAYRKEGNFSQFEKMSNLGQNPPMNSMIGDAEAISQIRLNTTINNQYTRQLALAFLPEATDAVDRGIDAICPDEEDLPNTVYFFLDNNRYVIQGVNFDVEKRIPVGIKSEANTTYTFDASMILNFDSNQDVYMYDALDGSYHDIKNGTYQVTLPQGVFNNRFEITFKNGDLHIAEHPKDSFIIVQNNSTQTLTVLNPNKEELKSVTLYDLNGKMVFDKQHLGIQESYQFSTNGLSQAVYLVEVLSLQNQKKAQKIVVSSK